MLKLSGCPRLTWGRVSEGACRPPPAWVPYVRRLGRWSAALSAVRLRPPLAASDPSDGPHFSQPRREARRANLRFRTRRGGGARSDVRRDAQAGVPSAG